MKVGLIRIRIKSWSAQHILEPSFDQVLDILASPCFPRNPYHKQNKNNEMVIKKNILLLLFYLNLGKAVS